ncbi:PAS domain-containing sensor histidine kinase [Flavobacterium sp. Root901]|uniref:PAS domain-containing protein n=1 Tax=Flavobacterium sp. Root901 TaxID=1736605 RepID=UPI000708E914|nr:PAS domain-containing protein [Flavobacterium sp. Root901]KRD10256.1 PAS domain-containing sensor histidine kinase [Flavobacterium sp. Root901]
MNNTNQDFLAKGGEMGELIRAKDWSTTPVGSVDTWPQSLRTTLGILLNSKFPMFLFWGPEHVCFYNDAYRPSLGNDGKHPGILGHKGAEFWPEIWDFIGPLINQVMTEGEATWHEDLLLPIYRNGKMEDVYWTFSYSPVTNDDDQIAGVLVICNETTDKVNIRKKLEESNERFRNNILQAPNAMCILRGSDFVVEIANDSMLEIWERKEHEVLHKPIFQSLPEASGQGLEEILLNVYTTGKRFTANELPVKLTRKGKIVNTFINVTYEAFKEPDGTISGIVAIANDVTLQVIARTAIEESEKRFKNIVRQVPLGIAILKGSDLKVEMVNETYLQIVDKTEEQTLHKSVFEYLPEARETVEPLLLQVYENGVPYFSNELPVTLNRYGKQEDCYFNLVFHPLREENNIVTGVIVVGYEVTEAVKTRYYLAESEKAFRNLVMQSPIAMTIFKGKDYIIELANTSMQKDIWQKELSETIGKPAFEVFPELLDQKYAKLLDDVLYNGKTIRESESIAYIKIKGKLEKFYFDFQFTPLYEKNGEISSVMITISNVTEKVDARKKVEDAEERARLASEIAEIVTWDLNIPTQELIYSDNLPALFGLPKNIKISRPQVLSRIVPDDFDTILKAYQTALKTNIYKYEARIIKPDDSIAWIRVHGKIFFDELKNPVKMLGTVMDITDEKNRQDILMKSEKKFRVLADSMPQFVWTSDAMGNLDYFNQSLYDYCGITKADVDQNGWLQVIHPDDREENINSWMQAVKTGNEFLFEHRFLRHDGEYRWQFSRAIPQRDPEGKIQMWVGTSSDIQDQKNFTNQLEKQVHDRTEELELKNRDLINMNIELQSFAYISSHDLQEPLRKIQTFASRLAELDEQNISSKAKSYLERIEVSAKRMQTLIQDLLTYSRTNSAERIFVKTNLDEIVEEVLMDFSERIEEKHAVIELHPLGEGIVMPFQFRQLLHNLIGNALKFTRKDIPPHIKIKARRVIGKKLNFKVNYPEKIYFCLSISDNGIGFEDEYNERIFEVFQRLNTESEFSGTGIGLAIVKKIVENHKGVIKAKSKKDEGATFKIFLPEL